MVPFESLGTVSTVTTAVSLAILEIFSKRLCIFGPKGAIQIRYCYYYYYYYYYYEIMLVWLAVSYIAPLQKIVILCRTVFPQFGPC